MPIADTGGRRCRGRFMGRAGMGIGMRIGGLGFLRRGMGLGGREMMGMMGGRRLFGADLVVRESSERGGRGLGDCLLGLDGGGFCCY
jgi:hypothetical protein